MKKTPVYMWVSASDVGVFTFIRWCKMKRCDGSSDTNKMGVGAVLYSPWRCAPPLRNSKDRDGLPVGYMKARPYWDLFYDNPYHCSKPRKLKRPTLAEYKRLEKRRKVSK